MCPMPCYSGSGIQTPKVWSPLIPGIITLYCLLDLPVKGLKCPRLVDCGHGEEAEVRILLVETCVEHTAGPNLSLSLPPPSHLPRLLLIFWGGVLLLSGPCS